MAGKNNRFQLFLFQQHERTAKSADANGVSLSTEVRNRVARSFWQDDVIAEIEHMRSCISPGPDLYDEATIMHLVEVIAEAKAKHFIPREDQ